MGSSSAAALRRFSEIATELRPITGETAPGVRRTRLPSILSLLRTLLCPFTVRLGIILPARWVSSDCRFQL